MASAINKKTGEHITRGIGYLDPTYTKNKDWIVNPTMEQVEQYKIKPVTPSADVVEKERLIAEKQREMAIEQLKIDGVLDADGNLK